MIISVLFFGIGALMLLFAYLVGVRKMYQLISGINTASKDQRAKMDLPAICKSMGICFAVIGFIFILAGGMSLVGIDWAVEAAFMIFFIVIWFMVIYIQRFDGNNFNETGRPKVKYYITVLGVSAIMIVVIIFGVTLYSGTLSSPQITFSGDTLEISGMYGTNIGKPEISEITLLEQPISFSAKTNGSAVLGAYKGNFTSRQYGPVLVYVKEESVPWIMIQRREEKPIILSLKNSKETNELYMKLEEWLETE